MQLSIVTAVFNRADTIGDALESLRTQTWTDWEHVVQDGGSTDGTLDVLQLQGSDRMRLESRGDGGVFDALNRAFARARGDVLGLLHSNDIFAAPDVLEEVVRAFADPEVDAVYGDLLYVARDDTSRVIRTWRSRPFDPSLLRRGWMPSHPALFLRRRVVEWHGAFDTTYQIAADYDAVLRYFRQPGFRAVHVPKVFVRMRVGGQSNRSLREILRKSREDLAILRGHGMGGALGVRALLGKNLSKVGQFL